MPSCSANLCAGTLSGRVYSLFCRMTGNQVHVCLASVKCVCVCDHHDERQPQAASSVLQAKVPENHTVDKSGKLQTAEGIAAENGDIENVDDKA